MHLTRHTAHCLATTTSLIIIVKYQGANVDIEKKNNDERA